MTAAKTSAERGGRIDKRVLALELAAKAWKLEVENKRIRKALLPLAEGIVYLSRKHVDAARKALGLPEITG